MKRMILILALAVTGCTVTDQQIDAHRTECARYGHTGGAVAECVERGVDRQRRATTATINTTLGVLLFGLL